MEYKLINSSPTANVSPIEQVLITRGIKLEDIFDYLNTTDDAILDYNTIDNIEEGVKMLFTHIMNEDDILVQVDPDADGYCSAAILINYLKFHSLCVFFMHT